MAEIKWIKITTDIFDDEKILLIESLPDAYAIITCWFKLLCLAGKMNNSGVFTMNDKIAYTDKMLSIIFRMKESTVQLALETFKQYGMIDVIDGVITIPNWSKHQNLDQLENKKEYMRKYMQEKRNKQKKLIECKTNSKTNVRKAEEEKEEEREGDKDKDIDIEIEKKEYSSLLLSSSQISELSAIYGEDVVKAYLKRMEQFQNEKGKKYRNPYETLKSWLSTDTSKPKKKCRAGNERDYSEAEMQDIEKKLLNN